MIALLSYSQESLSGVFMNDSDTNLASVRVYHLKNALVVKEQYVSCEKENLKKDSIISNDREVIDSLKKACKRKDIRLEILSTSNSICNEKFIQQTKEKQGIEIKLQKEIKKNKVWGTVSKVLIVLLVATNINHFVK